jgi:hypothetical protein
VLASMATEESPAGEQARATLALIRVLDSMSITPIPAWRDYHEYVARIEQNPDVVAELVQFAEPADAPDFLASTASRQAVAALQADLPARLNAALDAVLQPDRTDTALGVGLRRSWPLVARPDQVPRARRGARAHLAR